MSNNIEEEKNPIITKLSNYLKLPKAQRWICCEWFYSDIDKVIFESENDFSLCIKQSFPRLKTRRLRKKQWCILRGLIGKPRRCSDAFFHEERLMLEEKRQKIRLIQQRKVSEKELIDYKDLPQEIPLTLSIGHRVYSHICQPEEGVFLGTIAAVDPCEHTYRVVFDRASLGSKTVYDYEIKSVTPVQTIPIRAYIQTYRPKINSELKIGHNSQIINSLSNQNTPKSNQQILTIQGPNDSRQTTNPINLLIDDLNSINAMNNPAFAALLLNQSNLDPSLGINSPFKLNNLNEITSQCPTPLINSGILSNAQNSGKLGGFPIRLLLMITRLNKILNIKREIVSKLTLMNSEAEQVKANMKELTKDFQTNYAILVLDLEKLNIDLLDYLNGVQRYCEEFAPEFRISTEDIINSTNESNSKMEDIKEKINLDSKNIVTKLNVEKDGSNQFSKNNKRVKSKKLIDLITKLTSLFIQLKEYINSTNQRNNVAISNQNNSSNNGMFLSYYSRLINESIAEIKRSLSTEKMSNLFEDKVQVHINHIQSTLCHYNKLHAFSYEFNKNTEINSQSNFTKNTDDLENAQMNIDNSTESINYVEESYELIEKGIHYNTENKDENMPEEIDLDEEDEDDDEDDDDDEEAETDDSFNTTSNIKKNINNGHQNIVKKSNLHQNANKMNATPHKTKKITETKRLNNNLNSFKTVLCSNSSLP